jgi:type I restriction enzyme S subunit
MPLPFNLHLSTFILTMTPPGYKQTEVGVIPEEWEVKPFSQVLTRINAKEHQLQTLNYQEIGDYPIVDQGKKAIVGYSDECGKRFRCPKDGVIVFGDHTCITKFVDFDFLVGADGTQILKSKGVHFARFNAYDLERTGIQQTGYNRHFKFLKERFFVSPPLLEQRAIAVALSDVDALLAALDRLIEKQRDLKQAAMQQLLTGQTRLPGFKGKWETKRLGEITKIQRGASPRPIDSPIWFDENSSIGWVRISDVTRSGMFLQETTQRLSPLGVAHSRPVPTGSLIMSICATVGRPVITKIDVCIHDGFVVFDNPQADQLFLYYFLKWIEPDWSKHGQTGSQMNLNTGLINGTPIHLPPHPEQTAIATVLSDMDVELAALEQRRDKTRALKQGMMQELLTGRTRLV